MECPSRSGETHGLKMAQGQYAIARRGSLYLTQSTAAAKDLSIDWEESPLQKDRCTLRFIMDTYCCVAPNARGDLFIDNRGKSFKRRLVATLIKPWTEGGARFDLRRISASFETGAFLGS